MRNSYFILAKFSHLIFANDLKLFCKDDLHSINCLMEVVKPFSNCSGLEPNVSKSQIYLADVNAMLEDGILNLTGWLKGSCQWNILESLYEARYVRMIVHLDSKDCWQN